MFTVDKMSTIPIYEQLETQIKKFVLSGLLSPGDSLPSVRTIATDLSVNPNTVQRAFADLNRDGITVSVPGKGNFVTKEANDVLKSQAVGRLEKLTDLVSSISKSGVSREEILDAVEKGIIK